MLARQMSLTRRQVSNSFINARVRLWKPMVEEMYKEEMGDADMGAPTAGASLRNGAPGETQTEYGIVKLSREQGPSAEECSSLFPDGIVQSYGGSDRLMAAPAAEHHMSELGRFGSGTGVSLPLGLQHCEEAAYPFPVEVITVLRVWERTIRTTHPAASSVGTETANSGSTDSAPPIYYMIL